MPQDNAQGNPEQTWYKPDGETATEPSVPAQNPQQQTISWTASEFIDVHKGASWHLVFYAGLLLLGAVAYLLTKDYISSVVIILAGVIFAFVINKKPRQLPYQLDNRGVQIGPRFYDYQIFKSFDLILEGGLKSINLVPLKRFMPEISLYFPPEQEEAIVNLLSLHLPHDEHVEKSIDKLAKKLRF